MTLTTRPQKRKPKSWNHFFQEHGTRWLSPAVGNCLVAIRTLIFNKRMFTDAGKRIMERPYVVFRKPHIWIYAKMNAALHQLLTARIWRKKLRR